MQDDEKAMEASAAEQATTTNTTPHCASFIDPAALLPPLPDEATAPPPNMEEPSLLPLFEEAMMIRQEGKATTTATTTAGGEEATAAAAFQQQQQPPNNTSPPPKQAPNTAVEATLAQASGAPAPITKSPQKPSPQQELPTTTAAAPLELPPSPLIQALRNLFLRLTRQEFESEVEIERMRRATDDDETQHESNKQAGGGGGTATATGNNKKRAPLAADGTSTTTTRKERKKRKKNDDNNNNVAAAGGGNSAAAPPPPPPFNPMMMMGGAFPPQIMGGGGFPHPHPPPFQAGMPNMIMMQQQNAQNPGGMMTIMMQPHPPAFGGQQGQPLLLRAVYPAPPPPPPPAIMSPQALAAAAQSVVDDAKAKKKKTNGTSTTTTATTTAPANATSTLGTANFQMPSLVPLPKKTSRTVTQGASWYTKFNELTRFKRKFGHLNVEHVASKDESYKPLLSWVKYQKTCWRKRVKGEISSLTNTQIKAFVELGLGTFEKGPALMDRIPTELRKPKSRPVWVKQYKELSEFKEKFGHVTIPPKEPEYASLYLWTQKQLNEYRNFCHGVKSSLDENYITKLKEVGLITDGAPVDPKHIPWDERFNELKQFKKEYGHCDVSLSTHKSTHYKLAWWVENQRKAFRQRQHKEETGKKRENRGGVMTQEQLEKLASIGFRFNLKHIDFEERYANILEYKAANGHVQIPWSFKTYNNLGQWCYIVKKQYHDGKLLPERAAMLNSIEGWDWTLRGRKKGNKKNSSSANQMVV